MILFEHIDIVAYGLTALCVGSLVTLGLIGRRT